MAGEAGRIGARMREALRLLAGAGELPRIDLVAALAERGRTGDSPAYATIHRLQTAGLVHAGLVYEGSRLLALTPFG